MKIHETLFVVVKELKEERHDEAEIAELAKKIKEANKAKLAQDHHIYHASYQQNSQVAGKRQTCGRRVQERTFWLV